MVKPDGFPTERERRFLITKPAGVVAAAVVIVVIVFTISRLSTPGVELDLPFPNRPEFRIRLPSEVAAETTSRESASPFSEAPRFRQWWS